MMALRKVAAASVVLVAAIALQGCKKKTAAPQPPYEPHSEPPHAPPLAPPSPDHTHHPVAFRVAVDGYPCEHTWRATWRDGARSVCRTFCCYHRNRKTHRRTRHSYCRVQEHGHEVLRMCAPRGALLPLSFAETMEEGEAEEPLALSAPEADEDIAAIEEEQDDAEDQGTMTSTVHRLGALPLFACSAGFVLGGVTVFLALRPRLRGGAGSDEQKAPFIES